MEPFILILAMVAVGAAIAALAGPIWKGARPIGLAGDFAASILTAVVVGLIDWFVIPRLGFSETLKWAAVVVEPALAALLVLWVVRKVKR